MIKEENKKNKADEEPSPEIKELTGFNMADFSTTEEEIVQIAKKEIVTISVGLLSKQTFMRIHPNKEATVNLLLYAEDKEYYIVHREAMPHLPGLTTKTKLCLGISRNGDHFLFPITQPDAKGKQNPWHESRDKIAQAAKKKWVRCQPKKDTPGYDAITTIDKYPEPEWTDKSTNEILSIAFADHMIMDKNHPVVKAIKGIK